MRVTQIRISTADASLARLMSSNKHRSGSVGTTSARAAVRPLASSLVFSDGQRQALTILCPRPSHLVPVDSRGVSPIYRRNRNGDLASLRRILEWRGEMLGGTFYCPAPTSTQVKHRRQVAVGR